MQLAYAEDLAYIHDSGFGFLAVGAATAAIARLHQAGIHNGLAIDLGCGSGIAARRLCDAGFAVWGIDLSTASIALARERVPEGIFQVGSCFAAALPPCEIVTAIGEVFNYAFDPANSATARATAIARIHDALAPGGIFLLDVAGPDRAPVSAQKTFSEGMDWAILVTTESERCRSILTRRIVTFRKWGDSYKRHCETHVLHLIPPAEVTASLERVGFSVQTLARYGSAKLPVGLTAFLAHKPS